MNQEKRPFKNLTMKTGNKYVIIMTVAFLWNINSRNSPCST